MSGDWQSDVATFHRAAGHPVLPLPEPIPSDRRDLRIKLVQEEAQELVDAIRDGDLVETVDAVCDLIYVALGAACEAGVCVQPHWDEVQRSNMAKCGPGSSKRADGKTVKPVGWQPPNLRTILIQQGGRGLV